MYSRWCTGARPIPMEILNIYEDNNFEVMEEDFRCKIIPNLINESQARSQIEELINDSRNIIGNKTADEMLALTDNAAFFVAAIRYAILSDHGHSGLFSPDLSDTIQNSRLPSITEEFVGRKNELKECGKLLQERPTLFISGVTGIGKSEFAKYYADKNRKKYTNIIYLYYAGDLKKLLQLGKLSDPCLDVLRNLSLLSASGVLKNAFKNWLKLPSLNDVNYLAKYGFIHDDREKTGKSAYIH
jgi:hypothetical protein